MKLYYISFSRMPTEKAHGLTIAKSCEAFARAGAEVTLIVPRRATQFRKDIFETYRVEKNFTARFVPVLDLLRFSSARWVFWLSYMTFYISTFFILLFMPKGGVVVYTREAPILTFSVLGLSTALECHQTPVKWKRWLYFRLARMAKSIITISATLKTAFVSAGFDEENILAQSSGVDLTVFAIDMSQDEARRRLGLPIDVPIVIYTGNFTTMEQDKGIDDILRALRQLQNVLFVAVGGSDKDCARYETQARDLGVSERVRLIGFNPQFTLALYQRAANILLMPFPDRPHYRNNISPVKMFEYMASRRPIIATDLPTIREILNEKNAIIIPPDDPSALARAITVLLADQHYSESLALRAFINVQYHSWDERVKRTLSFIERA